MKLTITTTKGSKFINRCSVEKMTNTRMPKENDSIPFPHLQSWMHKRIPLPWETIEERNQRYLKEHKAEVIASSILSRLFKWLRLYKGNIRWVFYKFGMKLIGALYRFWNRMEIIDKHKIPDKGAIFIINHIAGQDVVMTWLSAFEKPTGVFTDMGTGWFADYMEKQFNFVVRKGNSPQMIEKMIRTILLENKYFSMWPEGTLERQGKVMQGFSGIVRVYATINAKKDIIPFVPVFMTPSHGREKIVFKILDPYFIPRDWLNTPEEGGKTPRQIIDDVMMKHAAIWGQKELAKNGVLERRRQVGRKTPWK